MKPNPLKMLALLFSVSAAGFYVWHASRKDPAQSQKPVPVTQADDFTEPLAGLDVTGKERDTATDNNQPETLIQSGKNPNRIIRAEEVKQLEEPKPACVVTAAEVEAIRKSMLSTSKSGRIMGDADIRRMLEVQPEKKVQVKPETLMRSSKSIDAILRKDDVKQLAEPPGEPEKNTNTQPSRK
jgi:cystathionine beta-lyase/cystathionine gamma-synthase